MKPIGNFGGIVAMGTVVALKQPGHCMALFHDDGRYIIGDAYARGKAKAWRISVNML